MPRSKLRSLLLGTGTAIVMTGTALAPATAAGTSPSGDVFAAAGYWSCTIPAGYTYTQVQSTLSCSSTGFSPQYYVVLPSDGLWACTIPAGYTFTATQSTMSYSTTGFATSYRLKAL
ncbi:hypothetical protein [Streptomyces mayteni]